MTQHDDAVSLRHMLEHAREAAQMIRGRTRADLDRDRMLLLALTRLLEIVGQAARRVSEATRARCREIPWPEVVGLRNRLTHGYDDVNYDILWQILTTDLPPLIAHLEAALRTGNSG